MEKFPILYKYTQRKQPQQWQIFVSGGTFYTEEGIVGGAITKSLPTVCKGKNIGRANETDPYTQALAEAASKYQKKLDKGYALTLDDSGAKFFEPMLAETASKKNVTFEQRTFVQPKLDGLRAVNESLKLTSRNGKPYVACPHLYQDTTILDGELYTHRYKDDFNKIVSLCKKLKPTAEDLRESADKVEFWAYDFPQTDGPFSERYRDLLIWHLEQFGTESNVPIKIVPTHEVFSWDDIDKYHAQFLEEGYEGTIIRVDLGPYENKRSKQLLKYKDFKDEEFEIVGYEEGIGGRIGTIGYFIMKHDKNPDQTFKSNVKGDFNFLREVWDNRETYIGTEATVKYFNRTPKTEKGGDTPRFPYIIKLNRSSYE